MNNKQQTPNFKIILLSQSAIVIAGGFFLWALDAKLPDANIGMLQAIALGALLAMATFLLFALLYIFGGKFAASLLSDLHRVSWIFKGYSWVHISCVAALAGIGEELLFRGFLQTWLNSHIPIVWAILLASLIFGLLHYLSHAYFICTVVMSIALGVGYYLTDSLLMVIVWHGVYDFIALAALIKFPRIIDFHSVKEN